MAKHGPIVIVDDDQEDIDSIVSVIGELGQHNDIRSFTTAQEAIDYLISTREQPFIILSDIKMPKMNGLQLRELIQQNEYLRKKAIPFIFYTDIATQENINKAYELTVQGFIKKAHSVNGVKEQLNTLFKYWESCLHPNRYTPD